MPKLKVLSGGNVIKIFIVYSENLILLLMVFINIIFYPLHHFAKEKGYSAFLMELLVNLCG